MDTARHRDLTRPHDFDDSDRAQKLDHAFDLVFCTCDLYDQGVACHIHDAGAEDLSQSVDFGAASRSDPHFDESQVTAHRRLMRDILHIDHIDQLVEIRLDAMSVDL